RARPTQSGCSSRRPRPPRGCPGTGDRRRASGRSAWRRHPTTGGVGSLMSRYREEHPLAGSTLPIALRRLGFDPAAASATFVATRVDVTGLVIYFSVAIVTAARCSEAAQASRSGQRGPRDLHDRRPEAVGIVARDVS